MGWINEIKNAKKSCDTATLRLQVYWDWLNIFLYIHNSHIFLHAGFPGFLQNNIIHLLHKCSWDFILRNTLIMMMYWTDLMLYCLKKEALNSWLVKSKAYGYTVGGIGTRESANMGPRVSTVIPGAESLKQWTDIIGRTRWFVYFLGIDPKREANPSRNSDPLGHPIPLSYSYNVRHR